MTLPSAILELKRQFVCEALDIACVHASWTSRHLEEGRDDRAIEAFEKSLIAIREAANEMKDLKTALSGQATIGEAAAEYRSQRQSFKRHAKAAA